MPNHIYNVVPSPPDARNFKLTALDPKVTGVKFPSSLSLATKCSPVVDQGNLGSCTANAIASGLREYMLLKAGKPLVRLSRLFLYYQERSLEGTINQDAGATLKAGMSVITKMGTCQEKLDPYDITQFTVQPTNDAITDALNYRIGSYFELHTIADIKTCLIQGFPVVTGMNVYESFESQKVAQTGQMPLPKKGEQLLGGHAVLIVGYRDSIFYPGGGYFTVRNSWGPKWGAGGYFFMPYKYIDPLLQAWEFWTAR